MQAWVLEEQVLALFLLFPLSTKGEVIFTRDSIPAFLFNLNNEKKKAFYLFTVSRVITISYGSQKQKTTVKIKHHN